MKKLVLYILAVCCLLTGCAAHQETAPTTQTSVTVSPLPVTIDIAHLDNCTVAVSLAEGDAYVDDTGVMQMQVTVYTHDLYDMVSIAQLETGDTLLIGGQDITVTSVEWDAFGDVLINGGLDVGGYVLRTENDTIFYEIGYSDVKSWYALGNATIQVSPDFQYTDHSDLDKDPVTWYPGDFLTQDSGIDYNFTPYNTTITIEDGKVIAMNRVYAP